MDATLVTRRTPSRRLARAVVILVAMTALFLGTGATGASAASDPSGSGASADTYIYCDAIGHQMWVYTQSFASEFISQTSAKILASDAGRPWQVFADWEGVGSSLMTHYDIRSWAGRKIYFYAKYRWDALIGSSRTYAGEYVHQYQWNGWTRQWVASSACVA